MYCRCILATNIQLPACIHILWLSKETQSRELQRRNSQKDNNFGRYPLCLILLKACAFKWHVTSTLYRMLTCLIEASIISLTEEMVALIKIDSCFIKYINWHTLMTLMDACQRWWTGTAESCTTSSRAPLLLCNSVSDASNRRKQWSSPILFSYKQVIDLGALLQEFCGNIQNVIFCWAKRCSGCESVYYYWLFLNKIQVTVA